MIVRKLFKKLSEKRGETLAEAVISIAIFSLLVLAVATLLGAAARITERAEESALAFRDARNNAVEGSYGTNGRTGTATVTVNGVVYSIGVDVYSDGSGLVAWRPQ